LGLRFSRKRLLPHFLHFSGFLPGADLFLALQLMHIHTLEKRLCIASGKIAIINTLKYEYKENKVG